MDNLNSGIKSDLNLLKFLALHETTYGKFLWKLIAISAVLFLTIWQFDFAHLTATGILPPATKLKIRIILSGIIASLSLLSLALLSRPYFKKYKQQDKLSDKELKHYLKHTNRDS